MTHPAAPESETPLMERLGNGKAYCGFEIWINASDGQRHEVCSPNAPCNRCRLLNEAATALLQAQARCAELEKGLRNAAYTLFQVKRLVDAGPITREFVRLPHDAACAILDNDAALLAKLAQTQSPFVVNWTTEGCPKHHGQPWSFTATAYTALGKRCPLCEPAPGAPS